MKENNTTTLAVAGASKAAIAIGARGLAPSSFEELWRLACAYAGSGMAPPGLQKPESAMIAMATGMELGLSPMASMRTIAVINGRASIYGDGAKALVESSGLLEEFDEHFEGDGDLMAAICTVKRKNRAPETTRFSVADARRAGLWEKAGPWRQYPKRMLQMRARSWRLRDTFADVLQGMSIAEEAQDIPQEQDSLPPDATPAQRVLAKATLLPDEPDEPDQFVPLVDPAFLPPGALVTEADDEPTNPPEAPEDTPPASLDELHERAQGLAADAKIPPSAFEAGWNLMLLARAWKGKAKPNQDELAAVWRMMSDGRWNWSEGKPAGPAATIRAKAQANQPGEEVFGESKFKPEEIPF